MKHSRASIFFALPLLLSLSSACLADTTTGVWSQRSSQRESKRWTLQEWMAQKERNQLMDVWLKLNSPSPYELTIGGSYLSYKNTQDAEFTSYKGDLTAYAQIFGLALEHENNTREAFSDLTGMLNLRLIGNSVQNSNLTLHYGLRTRTMMAAGNELRLPQQFAELSLVMHMNRHFGLLGSYRYFIPTNEITLGDVSGNITTGGIFIDFASLRIFGQSYLENFEASNSSPAIATRMGIESGLRIVF